MKHLLVMIALLGLAAPLMFGQTGSLTGMKICIDPGHGGHNPANDRYLVPDPGTEFWESESNFQKALLLRTLLQAKGAVVYLTRETNDYPDDTLEPSPAARVAFANREQRGLVSFHPQQCHRRESQPHDELHADAGARETTRRTCLEHRERSGRA